MKKLRTPKTVNMDKGEHMRTKQYKISLYDSDLDIIKKYQDELGMNRSEFVREAIRKYDISKNTNIVIELDENFLEKVKI